MNKLLLLYHSGYTEPVYDQYHADLVIQNARLVRTTSFIGSIMMSLLTLVAIFVPSISKVLPLYLTVAVIYTAIYLAVKFYGTVNSVVTLLCNYAFLTASFFFAIGLDVIQGNATATTVCVLLVALPLLIVDKPIREFLYFGAVSIVFMLESIYIKQSPKASIDVLNSVSFFWVGTFLGYKHNQMMLRNIIGQHMLEKQRDIDTLTSLFNKGALESRVDTIMAHPGARGSLIVIDMDNFKYINDTFGHHSGDEILSKIGTLLPSLFRSTDLVSRFGGDEFVIFLPMTSDMELLRTKAEQILEGVSKIRISADENYRAHVCMGIAIYPKDGSTYEELFRNADTAMYYVKKNGKNGYGFYDADIKQKILIVDDVEMNRAILRLTLKADYDILEASNGLEAFELLEKDKEIALIITDIQMPRMDGIEFITKLRAQEEYQNVAVIANTQYGDISQEKELLALGVDDFVYKAASPAVIQTRVKNVLKGKFSS